MPLGRICGASPTEPGGDAVDEAVAELAIGVEALLAVACGERWIGGRPILDLGGERPRQVERLVMGFRSERDDEVEAEPFGLLQVLEAVRAVTRERDADL